MSEPTVIVTKFVQLLGERHVVRPIPFAVQTDLAESWLKAQASGLNGVWLRWHAAAVGLCTRVGDRSGVKLSACGWDPLVYGERVLDWMSAQGLDLSGAELPEAGRVLLLHLVELRRPKPADVEEVVGNSDAGGQSSTSTPSGSPSSTEAAQVPAGSTD